MVPEEESPISTSDVPPPPDAIPSLETLLSICGALGRCIRVIQNGFKFTKAFGVCDVEHQVPIHANSKFPIGSVYKKFLSAAVVGAAMGGKIQFDDPLIKFIPEFCPTADADLQREATLSNCLSHTSGLVNPQMHVNVDIPCSSSYFTICSVCLFCISVTLIFIQSPAQPRGYPTPIRG
jgi:CubicO group peptidase (beta-lactamase class C family)